LFYFRFDKATKELKEATPYIARFNELNSKFGQTLIDNKNLKDANKVRLFLFVE
jgi:lamin B